MSRRGLSAVALRPPGEARLTAGRSLACARDAKPHPGGDCFWQEERGCSKTRSDDRAPHRTHNAPYGRGVGRAAGGVTGGGSPAPAECSLASWKAANGGGGAEPPGAIPCEASVTTQSDDWAVELLWLRGGRFDVDRRGVVLKL